MLIVIYGVVQGRVDYPWTSKYFILDAYEIIYVDRIKAGREDGHFTHN